MHVKFHTITFNAFKVILLPDELLTPVRSTIPSKPPSNPPNHTEDSTPKPLATSQKLKKLNVKSLLTTQSLINYVTNVRLYSPLPESARKHIHKSHLSSKRRQATCTLTVVKRVFHQKHDFKTK